jgi:O-succinylbenzoic acid--CoA ligase
MIDPWLERADGRRVALEADGASYTYADLRAGGPDWLPRDRVVVHTSGTTGEPVPVELEPARVEAQARGTWAALGLNDDERWLCPLPLTHVGGLMVLLRSFVHGTTAIVGGVDRLADATVASLVPTQLVRLLDAGAAPPGALILLGGAPAGRPLLERARDAGWRVAPSYGLTEACSSVTIGEPGDVETSGRPIPGVSVEIAADGEVLVRGATVAGTLRTGDLGHLDDRGRLVVSGRRRDLVITGGENVAPAEVEAVLLAHAAVAEAAVFGRPDREWGEALTAQVVLRAPATGDELRAFCAQRLPGFKVPKAVEVVDALPRTAAGKILRRELA